MRRARAIARKELGDILRERSIVLALLVQLFVAAFSSFLTIGLVGLYDPEASEVRTSARVAYVGPGGFDSYLRDAPSISMTTQSYDEAVRAFGLGAIDGVIEETTDGPEGVRTITLLLPEAEVRTTLLVTQLKALLREYEKDLRFDREDRIEETVIYAETDSKPEIYYGFVFTVLLPLLVITPIFLAGATSGDSLGHELQAQTMGLLRSTPTSALEIVLGKVLTPVLLVPAQVALWISLLWMNGVSVAHPITLLLFATALGLALSSASILVALLVRRPGQTQAAYALLVLAVFLLVLMLPHEPLNLVALLGAGSVDPGGLIAVALYGVASVALFLITAAVAQARLARDEP